MLIAAGKLPFYLVGIYYHIYAVRNDIMLQPKDSARRQ